MRRAQRAAIVIVLGAFAALSVPFAACSTGLSPAARSEIAHLLAYIERSGCQFYRNGTWYRDTTLARKHVERKYHYFAGKGRVTSSEDFITWAASKSELSGEPYMVKSGDAPPMPLARWLTEELARYRGETPASRNE